MVWSCVGGVLKLHGTPTEENEAQVRQMSLVCPMMVVVVLACTVMVVVVLACTVMVVVVLACPVTVVVVLACPVMVTDFKKEISQFVRLPESRV